MYRKILTHNKNGQLRLFSHYVDVDDRKEMIICKELIKDLRDTMYVNGGIGLAAPQIGVFKRIFIMDIDQVYSGFKKPIAFINPRIVKVSEEMVEMQEGCLSVKNFIGHKKYKKVFRPYEVNWMADAIITFGHDSLINDPSIEILKTKNKKQLSSKGLWARVVQHEIDHLNGKLFIDLINLDL